MNLKPLPLAIVAVLALTVAPPPVSAALNECVITGATDSSGTQVAPPCLDTRANNTAVRGVQDTLCGANAVPPQNPPLPSRGTCTRLYILLVPEQDGRVEGGQFQYDFRLVWEETNGCDGLQRFRGPCGPPDRVLLVF